MFLSRYLLVFFLLISPYIQAQELSPEVAAIVEAKPIDEMSGIARSVSYPGVFWVLNDSGDEARIFAIKDDGKNVIPTYSRFSFYGEEPEEGKELWQGFPVLYAENVDWESMTIDSNYLYIADTGNNRNDRKDLGIYLISEIDPTASTRSAVIKHVPVYFPEQQSFPADDKHFDSEALFVDKGVLYLITKHRENGLLNRMATGANLYRLDTMDSDNENPLILVDSHKTLTATTGAELSPDGQTLAVISYTDLWLFERPQEGDQWLSAPARQIPLDTKILRQVEAVSWVDDETLILTNEQRDVFLIPVNTL